VGEEELKQVEHRLQNISLHFHQETRGNTREKQLRVTERHIFRIVYQKYVKTAIERMDKLCFNFGLSSEIRTEKSTYPIYS